MPAPSHLLFLQKRAIRAGAQTSLARLVDSTPLRDLHPAALLGSDGWLSAHLGDLGVEHAVLRFPSPRSLASRLFGLGSFTRFAAGLLADADIAPSAIVANDHQECPLALALATRLGGLPVLAILRTPGMTRGDYDKYRCNQCHGIMAEGTELLARVREWTEKEVTLFEEGFAESEFRDPKPHPASFPERILVIGSEARRKGFTDFIEALDIVEEGDPDFPGLACDFTGTPPDDEDELARRPRRSRFRFLGRVNDFPELVRSYDLAIHPSRAESFGMAPLEAILAGIPTMVSTTGIVPSLPFPEIWTFPPEDPGALARKLATLRENWAANPLNLPTLQDELRARFHIDHTAAAVRGALNAISATTAI